MYSKRFPGEKAREASDGFHPSTWGTRAASSGVVFRSWAEQGLGPAAAADTTSARAAMTAGNPIFFIVGTSQISQDTIVQKPGRGKPGPGPAARSGPVDNP